MAEIAFITTVDEVRANGVKANFINADSDIADMITAQQMFIVPVIGKELYDAICEDVDGHADLMPYIKRALSPLAYWLDLPNIQTQITDKGIQTSDSNNMTAAHYWEFETLRENLAAKGCFYLEQLLAFLNTPEITAAYEWQIPSTYNLLFKTGIEFNDYFTLYQPYRVFENLRPQIKQIEDEYLRPTIGDDFFEELRDTVLPADKTTWSADQKKINQAIVYLKSSAANLSVARAVNILPVRISNEGFTISLKDVSDKSRTQVQAAGDTQLYNLRDTAQKSGETYLLQLTEYLNKNASNTVFTTYKNSSYYTAPVAEDDTDPNSTTNIFVL